MKIQLKRSNVLSSGAAKVPTASQLEYGELAVNYNNSDPAIFLKDSNNNIIRISGVGNIADDGLANVPDGTTPPANPEAGNLWYNSDQGRLYIYFQDADTSQWVDASPDSWDPSSYPDVTNSSAQSGTLDDRYAMVNGGNGLRVDSSGNIGVGTTSPRRQVHIHNSASATVGLMLTNANTGAENDSQGLHFKVSNDGNAQISQMENKNISIFTNATERMRIDSSGRVGIANTIMSSFTGNASDNLVVGNGSGSEGITVYSAVQGSVTFADGASGDAAYRGSIEYSHTNDNLTFRTAGAGNRMIIDSSGRMLIGSTSSYASANCDELQVGNTSSTSTGITIGSSTQGQIAFANSGDNRAGLIHYQQTDNSMRFMTNGAANERMRVDSSGNVLVGKTASTGLTEGCELRSTGIGLFTRASANPLQVRRLTDDGDLVEFYQDSGLIGSVGVQGSSLTVGIAGQEKIRIESSGNIKIIGSGNAASPKIQLGETGYINSRRSYDGSTDEVVEINTSSGPYYINCSNTGGGGSKFNVKTSGSVSVLSTDVDALSVGRIGVGYGLNIERSGLVQLGTNLTASGEDVKIQLNPNGSITANGRTSVGNENLDNYAVVAKNESLNPTVYARNYLNNSSALVFGGYNSGSSTVPTCSISADGSITAAGELIQEVGSNKVTLFNNYLRAAASGDFYFDQATVGRGFYFRLSTTSSLDSVRGYLSSAGDFKLGGVVASAPNIQLNGSDGSITAVGQIINNNFDNDTTPGVRIKSTGNTGRVDIKGNGGASDIAFSIKSGGTESTDTVVAMNADGSAEFTGTGTFGRSVDIEDGNLNVYSATNNLARYPLVVYSDIGGTKKEKFHVQSTGSVRIGGTLPSSPNIELDGSDGSITAAGAVANSVFSTNGYELHTVGKITARRANSSNSQQVFSGFAGTTETSKIFSDGSATFTGTVTAANITSDIRFKENIADANPQLADVVALGSQLKNWNWTDDAPLNDELRAKRFLGLVAQEAEKVCPDVAYSVPRTKQGAELTPETTDEEGNVTPATYEELDDSYKAIKHDVLIMKLLGAVAELSAKVAALESA